MKKIEGIMRPWKLVNWGTEVLNTSQSCCVVPSKRYTLEWKSWKKNDLLSKGQIRRSGGGRKSKLNRDGEIERVFLEVIEGHIAGDPMNEKIRWLNVSRAVISEKLRQRGIWISRHLVKKLMKKHHLVKRKIQRQRSCGRSPVREQQFDRIKEKKAAFLNSENPIISIDTKKKEDLGQLHRDGQRYCSQALESYDHDYSYLSEGKVIPHGIYDMKQNKAYINLGMSHETAAFVCDSIKNWWLKQGVKDYPTAREMLIFCDAGGANSYRHYLFKEALQQLATDLGLILHVTHYPPYTSKWNPIEHRVFPHVTRAMEGIMFNTVEEAKQAMESAKTKTGLGVVVDIIQKTYEVGKRATQDILKKINIQFDQSDVKNLNYVISPQET